MIKSELITNIANRQTHMTDKDVELSVNRLLEYMSNELAGGGRIEIRGFGSFSLHYRPPRNAHNPKTGKKLVTEAKYTPHFKPGKELRERINTSAQHVEIQAFTHEEDEDDDTGSGGYGF